MEKLNAFLDTMWTDYCKMNPQAALIYKALSEKNKHVLNDHIALRTFNSPKLGIKSLAQHFEKYGYEDRGEYVFKEKKLYAKHYEHKTNPDLPKIFISELKVEEMPDFVQKVIANIVEQIPQSKIDSEDFIFSGTHWPIEHNVYEKLAEVSEYASWVYAWGFRPNHFTVSINHMNQTQDILELNAFIKSLGVKLNASGGEVKGTPEELLEQSSTMANEEPVKFKEGVFKIPACYYEFAKRYKMDNGKLYQGFIAKSADKIFESTNKLKNS
jgi:hypothetical protein